MTRGTEDNLCPRSLSGSRRTRAFQRYGCRPRQRLSNEGALTTEAKAASTAKHCNAARAGIVVAEAAALEPESRPGRRAELLDHRDSAAMAFGVVG